MPLQALQTAHCTARFNRYMVECEYETEYDVKLYEGVLIDTWWNVNPIKLVTHCAAALVLIDTWWNVN